MTSAQTEPQHAPVLVIDLAKAAFDHTVHEAMRHGLISGPRVPGIPRPRRAAD